MTDETLLEALSQAVVLDSERQRIGKVGQLFLDDQSGRPSWVTVHTGLFGTSETFVPMQGSAFDNDELKVAFTKDFVKDAPHVAPEGHLDLEAEDELYRYYGIDTEDAEARDQFDPLASVTPASERDTDAADWNKTAGLHEGRPDQAERETDHTGGLEAPHREAAQQIPPVREHRVPDEQVREHRTAEEQVREHRTAEEQGRAERRPEGRSRLRRFVRGN